MTEPIKSMKTKTLLLNNIKLLEWNDAPVGEFPSKKNPFLNITIHTPTIKVDWNKINPMGEPYKKVHFDAPTGAYIITSDGYFGIGFAILGFGFMISRQTDY